MAYVYVSYSLQDSRYARQVIREFERRGIAVFYDTPATPGQRWPTVVGYRIDGCAAFVVIASSHARASDWVRRQVEYAAQCGKPILALLLEDGPWFGMRGVRSADVSEGELPPESFYDLLRQDLPFPESAPSPSERDLWRPFETFFRGRPQRPAKPEPGDLSLNKEARSSPEPVQMSAYYPQEMAPLNWHPLQAYIYRASAAAQVRQDAQRRLGTLWDLFNRTGARATQPIEAGAHVTATPQLDGFEFEPVSVTIAFREAWHCFDFELRAVDAPLDRDALGSVTFTVEGIVVADVPLSIYASEGVATPRTTSTIGDPYRKVFCSYSHQDRQIADRVQVVCEMMDLEYLRDVYTLKAGEVWNPRLLELVEEADVFQLFWSLPASQSKYVRQEWEHALSLEGRPPRFVRPYFWKEPMPEPPAELRHLHFEYEPRLAE